MGGYVSTANPPSSADGETEEMKNYLSSLPKKHLEPLWSQMNAMVPPVPRPTAKPYMWKYQEALPYLQKAGQLVPEDKAERRVLMLVNPSMSECPFHQEYSFSNMI